MMIPARITISYIPPQPREHLEYWLVHCVCGWETTIESAPDGPLQTFDEAYQHYTSDPQHHSSESKLFIDYGPEVAE